ncbi:MAG TPA: hypothetical protein VNA14_09115 [Mycobacteriales bacterium]|nr:hypothetical protein [Mycobacteriales bacterium]
MADRRLPDVVASVGDAERPPGLVMGRGASVVAGALGVQLLLAVAVAGDRRSAEPPRRSSEVAAPSPTPLPSRSPEVITAAQGVARRRVAVNTARFTASQVCADSSAFVYDVVRSSSDAVETMVAAHAPDDASGILVKVTLLQGGYGVSYKVIDEYGSCDG